MTFSLRQLVGAVCAAFCLGALIVPVATQGGQSNATPAAANPPRYMLVEFMKVTPGKESDYMKLERETWKPMHEMRVKEGSIVSWAAIDNHVPGDESDGPIVATVTTFRGFPDPTKTDWAALIKKAHPQTKPETIFEQTEAVRRIVRSEIWHVVDQTAPPPNSGTR